MALGLDVLIRQKFGHQKSIREVMLLMNERFGQLKQGYTLQGFYQLCSEVYESDLSNWFARWMESSTDLFEELNTLLAYIGLELQMSDSELHLKKFDEERFHKYRKS